jgi:hypothetical protein
VLGELAGDVVPRSCSLRALRSLNQVLILLVGAVSCLLQLLSSQVLFPTLLGVDNLRLRTTVSSCALLTECTRTTACFIHNFSPTAFRYPGV